MDTRKINGQVTDMVCKNLGPEDTARYRELIAKDNDTLSSEERKFLKEKEEAALTQRLDGPRGLDQLFSMNEEPGCTCNAGWSDHKSWCKHYGKPSLLQQGMRAIK